jgi:hypothetical protein
MRFGVGFRYPYRVVIGWFTAFALAAPAAATTVVAPTFEQLVARAEIVFEGEVTATQVRVSADREGSPIVTDVTFRVARTLKGKVGPAVTLEFLGGTVDGRTLHVDGVPTFRVGDRDVLFAITSQRLVSPLVGMMHGRFRIVSDSATRQALVRRHDGQPLRSVATLGGSEPQAVLSQQPAMSLEAFENAVLTEVARSAGRAK